MTLVERFAGIALWTLAALIALIVLRLALLSFLSKAPDTLGARNGRLAPCPKRPNCVSSQAKGKSHSIASLRVDGSATEALASARRAIESIPRARVVTVEDGYLHAEFSSRLFRFVDDLELLYDAGQGAFQVRSASRVGHSDLGANRKRVDALRHRLASAGETAGR